MSDILNEALQISEWPLLPQPEMSPSDAASSNEIAVHTNLLIPRDDLWRIPLPASWVISDGISYASSVKYGLYVSVDPVVIDLVRAERKKEEMGSNFKNNSQIKESLRDIGRVAMAALYMEVGSVTGNYVSGNQLWGTIVGAIAGVGVGALQVLEGIDRLYQKESGQRIGKQRQIQESPLTYKVPKSASLPELPEKVKRLLESDENPKQLFINTMMPSISAAMGYEQRLSSIVKQLTEIEERLRVFGEIIDTEEMAFVELTKERKEISAMISAHLEPIDRLIIELDESVKLKASAKRLEERSKLLMLEDPRIKNDGALREFYTSVCLALEATYIPQVNDEETLLALEDIDRLIVTTSDPQLFGPIYVALRSKYKSLNMPEYENLQSLIARGKEPI